MRNEKKDKKLLTALGLAVGLVSLAGYGVAESQPAETPAAKEPFRVETPVQVAPITIAVQDPEELQLQLEELRQRQRQDREPVAEPGEETADREQPAQRVIEIDAPRVVNGGPEFGFRDATLRDGGHARLPKLTMQQRRAAVEAYRRGLTKNKKKNDGR